MGTKPRRKTTYERWDTKLLPLVLRPRWVEMWNGVFHRNSPPRKRRAAFLVSSFSLIVIMAMHSLLTSAFTGIEERWATSPQIDKLRLEFISALFSGLCGLVFAGACVHSLSVLFLARDVDRYLASPLSARTIMGGKMIEIGIRSGWVMLVFSAPIFSSLAVTYHLPGQTIVALALHGLLLLTIPTACAVTFTVFIASWIPAHRVRELAVIISLIGGLSLFLLMEGDGSTLPAREWLRPVMGASWFPPSWTATLMARALISAESSAFDLWILPNIVGVVSVITALVVLAWRYEAGVVCVRQTPQNLRLKSRLGHAIFGRMTFWVSQHTRALASKELIGFSRDLGQTVQFVMLLGICFLYLYNFRILGNVTGITDEARLWWQALLLLCNALMSALIMTAVSTRFVFPSISLEGPCWWIIRSAPVALDEVLRSRVRIWAVPMCCAAALIHAAGACAVNAPLAMLLMVSTSAILVTYAITGLAIGLGSVYANFDWEQSSQATSSAGSLMYLFVSTLLVLAHLIPLALAVVVWMMSESGILIPNSVLTLSTFGSIVIVAIVSRGVTNWALRLGTQELVRREN